MQSGNLAPTPESQKRLADGSICVRCPCCPWCLCCLCILVRSPFAKKWVRSMPLRYGSKVRSTPRLRCNPLRYIYKEKSVHETPIVPPLGNRNANILGPYPRQVRVYIAYLCANSNTSRNWPPHSENPQFKIRTSSSRTPGTRSPPPCFVKTIFAPPPGLPAPRLSEVSRAT